MAWSGTRDLLRTIGLLPPGKRHKPLPEKQQRRSAEDWLKKAAAEENDSLNGAADSIVRALAAEPSNAGAWRMLDRVLSQKANAQRTQAVVAELDRRGIAAPSALGQLTGEQLFAEALRQTPEDPDIRSGIAGFLRTQFLDKETVTPLHDALARWPLPTHIRIETVSACNLRCQHCTTGVAYHSTDRRIMRMETFDTIIEQLQDIPTVKTGVMYLGGEPLMNKHHATMCRRVKEETSIEVVKFVTNGMLLTEEWCDKIAAANVDLISISIDGRSPEEHNRIRVGSDYETIRANIWMLRRRLEAAGAATRVIIGNTVFRRTDDPTKPETPNFLREEFPISIFRPATRWSGPA